MRLNLDRLYSGKKVFFSSDLHLNHNPSWEIPIWKQRGFNSVQEMNDGIIKSINDTVNYDDVLFLLGDFTLNCKPEQFHNLRGRINCQNILTLFGNHPSPILSIYKDFIVNQFGDGFKNLHIYPLTVANVTIFGHYAEAIVDNQLIILQHFPLSIWEEQKRGAWHLTGHSHGGFEDTLPTTTNTGKILDVGWDVFRKPVSMNDIRSIMAKKQYVKKDRNH